MYDLNSLIFCKHGQKFSNQIGAIFFFVLLNVIKRVYFAVSLFVAFAVIRPLCSEGGDEDGQVNQSNPEPVAQCATPYGGISAGLCRIKHTLVYLLLALLYRTFWD